LRSLPRAFSGSSSSGPRACGLTGRAPTMTSRRRQVSFKKTAFGGQLRAIGGDLLSRPVMACCAMLRRSAPTQRKLFDEDTSSRADAVGSANREVPRPQLSTPAFDRKLSNDALENVRPPPFVAPDRQWPIDVDEAAAFLLLPPAVEQDAISIDRRRTDIDGPPHRFTIRLGDTVEALVSCACVRYGKVVDICRRRREVRVVFEEDRKGEGEWIALEYIFPAPPIAKSC
jgi:hypothetical protein